MNIKYRTRTLAPLIIGIGLVLNGYSQSFLTNGLVAYYPFNGNALDASGNGHDGTVQGAVLTTNRFGEPNGAYLFAGPAAYITAPLNSTVFSNDFTASVWFNANDIANGWPTLLHQENSSFLLSLSGSLCGCSSVGDLISFSVYHGVPTKNWELYRKQTPINKSCQVVITKAGATVTMYLNSQVAATNKVNNTTTLPGNTLWVGRAPTEDVPGGYVFHGALDDIRIYNRALSSNEVAQLYAIESSGPRVDLIKAVKPAFSNLMLTTNYQMQLSGDMNSWTNHGSAFTATNTSMVYPQYWDVANWGSLFFRLQVAP